MSEKKNPVDEEIDFLESEFLKYKDASFPFPKTEIKIYEDDVQELMKSGCNRQIAEYAMLKYKELEDAEYQKDNNFKKLCDLRKEYFEMKNPIINRAVTDLVNAVIERKNIELIDENNEMDKYDEEINEMLENEKVKELSDVSRDDAKCFFKKYFDNLRDNKEKYNNLRKEYINKRDAVIEAGLRKIKKIVNDEEEYKIFYKEYYKKEPEDDK